MSKLEVLLSILFGLFFIVPVFGYFVTSYFHTCFIGCLKGIAMCKYITYDINGDQKKKDMKKPCIFNGWNLSHILLFMTLSILFPEYYALLFVAGFVWECTEYLYGLNNWLDIAWNTIGITLGLTINQLTPKYNKYLVNRQLI